MALPALLPILGAVGSIGGALGGLLGGGANNNTSTVTPGRGLPGQDMYRGVQDDSLKNLQGLFGAGPGMQDVQQSYGLNQGLISMLGQYAQSGGLPGQQDLNAANQFAGMAFQPQRTQLNQQYTQQGYQNQQEAARLGRPVNDPILAARLQTNKLNQEAMINAQQGAYGSNLALQLPQQRLGYAQQQAGLADQLAQQAQSNQYTLLGLGSQLYNRSLDYGLATATRTGSQQQGGSVGGAIGGALGGFGMGAQLGQNLFGQGGMFGQPAGQPRQAPNYSFGQQNPMQNFGVSFGQSLPSARQPSLMGGGF